MTCPEEKKEVYLIKDETIKDNRPRYAEPVMLSTFLSPYRCGTDTIQIAKSSLKCRKIEMNYLPCSSPPSS